MTTAQAATFTRTAAALVAAIILAFTIVPVAAIADVCCDPASDAMATQDPAAFDAFINKPCATRQSVNCYWDAIGRADGAGWSYWSIRVGDEVCIRYWDARVNRLRGHCSPLAHGRSR